MDQSERLAQIARINGEIKELEDKLQERHDELTALIRAGRDADARTFAAALPAEVASEIVALAKIPGIKRLKELTHCDLGTAVDVYDVLRESSNE